jgi:hypothetical protein
VLKTASKPAEAKLKRPTLRIRDRWGVLFCIFPAALNIAASLAFIDLCIPCLLLD